MDGRKVRRGEKFAVCVMRGFRRAVHHGVDGLEACEEWCYVMHVGGVSVGPNVIGSAGDQ